MVNQKLIFHVVIYSLDYEPFLAAFDQKDLTEHVNNWSRENAFGLVAASCQSDHLHLLIEQVGESSIQKVIQQLLDGLWDWSLQESCRSHNLTFAMFTVSFSQIEMLTRFINAQSDHHEHVSFDEELTSLLDKHDAEQMMLPSINGRQRIFGLR